MIADQALAWSARKRTSPMKKGKHQLAGSIIRTVRKRAKLTQHHVAIAINKSAAYVQLVEAGLRRPTCTDIMHMSRFINEQCGREWIDVHTLLYLWHEVPIT